ncbi:hypothetical protein LJR231_002064 [Phyllobacterium sp. LjRoot231]|uniref:hypothetical protein n=1 Tax=Phyllobacterium sp. LjRoot231 TaxID=3342289 RepID=UPI003ECF8977
MTAAVIAGQHNVGPVSRPLDVHRWSDYRELNDCLTELVTELEAREQRQRKRKGDDAKRFREAVRCLVLDLYVAWKTDPELEVSIHLDNGHYSRRTRYRSLFIKWSSFTAAYYALVAVGYIRVVRPGFHDRKTGIGRVTRIAATERLIQLLTDQACLNIPAISSRLDDMEVILLRDSSKKPMEYQDTDATRSMRSDLQRINTHLQNQWIDIRLSDAEFRDLQLRMQLDYEHDDRERPFIDFTQRALVRIFNNGDWEQGGRFYRGWWQSVPKEYRRFITINDKRTVEVDYSTLHPILLYAQVGHPLQGDAYDIGLPQIPRSLTKQTFNKMINATGRMNKPPEFDAYDIGLDWQQFRDAIAARHEPIKHFFNTGYGMELQRIDADIAQRVMLRFIEMGYVCLPVHDSFLVHYALADELKSVMVQEFQSATGQHITVKAIEGHEVIQNTGLVTADIADLLDETGTYAGYEKRMLDWYRIANPAGSA